MLFPANTHFGLCSDINHCFYTRDQARPGCANQHLALILQRAWAPGQKEEASLGGRLSTWEVLYTTVPANAGRASPSSLARVPQTLISEALSSPYPDG